MYSPFIRGKYKTWTPGPWTNSVDQVNQNMDQVHGPPIFTTPNILVLFHSFLELRKNMPQYFNSLNMVDKTFCLFSQPFQIQGTTR